MVCPFYEVAERVASFRVAGPSNFWCVDPVDAEFLTLEIVADPKGIPVNNLPGGAAKLRVGWYDEKGSRDEAS